MNNLTVKKEVKRFYMNTEGDYIRYTEEEDVTIPVTSEIAEMARAYNALHKASWRGTIQETARGTYLSCIREANEFLDMVEDDLTLDNYSTKLSKNYIQRAKELFATIYKVEAHRDFVEFL